MRPFIEEVGRVLDFPRLDLIEKDVKLHNMLLFLSCDKNFSDNFLFKGGTCLIKSYLGYFRFSEDIDFTWRDQGVFDGMSQKGIRKYLSDAIDRNGKVFEGMGEAQGFEFITDKGNDKYVELGGSNKIATFKLWYDSEILGYPMFVKVQFNFVEMLKYPEEHGKLKSLLSDQSTVQLEKFFPDEYKRYSKAITFKTYDIREILCEKVRAILTRRGTKARDFLDIFLIMKNLDEKVSGYKSQIVEKTRFTLDMYEKYRLNLGNKRGLIESRELFEWGQEKELLLLDIDEMKFGRFIDDFSEFLIGIIKELE